MSSSTASAADPAPTITDAALLPRGLGLALAGLLLLWLAAWLAGPALLAALGLPLDAHGHLQANAPAVAAPFADVRPRWGIPNAFDVLSNLPFALAGLWGLARLRARTLPAATRRAAQVFFAGLLLTSLGSAWYHWAPDAGRLAGDRLGMAVAFAGVWALVVAERLTLAAVRPVLWGVLLLGAVSAAWPQVDGNVLPWAVVQYGGIGFIVWAWRRPMAAGALGLRIGAVLAAYLFAKLLEMNDFVLFEATGQAVSGHSLKHLAAALAALPVLAAVGRAPLRQNAAGAGTPRAHRPWARAGLQDQTMRTDAPPAAASPAHANQFALLRQRRFAPFFWTQFAGAANDNLFKFAFTVMVTYQLQVAWLPPSLAGLAIGALFILPFLLFSATAGQLTDKYDKARIIRLVKTLEIAIMGLAGWGFVAANVPVLLGCVFLMGLHSTLFGPVKFAYLPQALDAHELTGGNGMVEMGTFVAILLGQVAGGLLVALPGIGHGTVAAACVAVAVIGRLTAQAVPAAPATDPTLAVNWNPVSETWRNLRLAHGNTVVFRSLLGISWMWFFGATFLSQFPSFAKEVLHGDAQVASLLLVVFSVGIGAGSLLCETLSRRQVEIGLVPLGAIGMSVFAVDLYFASRGLPPSAEMGLGAFLAQPAHWRVMADLALLSLFAGLYSVPMYALIQLRSQPTHRARIIAANNILNALFMIASAVIAGALIGAGFSIPQVFLFTGIANALVAGYIFLLVPEYLLRFIAWVASRLVYRFKVRGDEQIPDQGPAVLVCNHVSFVDAVLLMAASPRPIRFLMDHRIFRVPVLGWLFRLAKAIPIAPQKEDPAAYERAFDEAAQVLREGDLLGIFPEGGITRDGTLQPFKGGVMKILACAQEDGLAVPVVPMALTNLWGSYFSRIELRGGVPVAMVRPFRRGFWSRVGLNVGAPLPASAVQPELLQERVAGLLAQP